MLIVIEQKREVVYSYASDIEILSRQLREAYYAK